MEPLISLQLDGDPDTKSRRLKTGKQQHRVILPKHHMGQKRLSRVMYLHRFVAACVGRRWGKTTFAGSQMVEDGLNAPLEILWTGPTYDHVNIGYDMFKRWCPPGLILNDSKKRRQTTLINGTNIYWRSSENPDSMIGRGYDRAYLDEASRISEEAWYRAVRPALSERGGSALLTTTPAGKKNFFYEMFKRGQNPDYPDTAAFHGPSWENTLFPALREEIEEQRKHMPPEIFAQEYEAIFLEDVLSAVQGFSGVWLECMPASMHPSRKYIIGVDLAKYKNWTVISVWDVTEKPIVLKTFVRFQKSPWQRIIDQVKEVYARYNKGLVMLDSTGAGDPIYEAVCRAGVRCIPYRFETNQLKRAVIEPYLWAIENQQLVIPNTNANFVWKSEHEIFERILTDSGNILYAAPDGYFDDTVISGALAWYGFNEYHNFQVSTSDVSKGAYDRTLSSEEKIDLGLDLIHAEF